MAFNIHPTALSWASLRTGAALVIGPNQNPGRREQVGDAGRYLPLIPAANSRSELRLTAPERASSPIMASYFRFMIDAMAPQNRFYAVDGAETRTPGYVLCGAGLGTSFRTKGGREAVQLVLQADNLFDVAYQSHLNRLKHFEYYAASPTGRLGIFSPGRNLSAKVVVPF